MLTFQKRFLVLVLCGLSVFAFSHGKKDVEVRSAENTASWEETFDISEKKKGKWNVIVEAVDSGRNIKVVGPFNIYVDPASDLPVVGITNPLNNAPVSSNLNIVGTAFDDDGIASIQLVFDGDKENPVKAKGAEFWSHYLNTSGLQEGPHTIEAYAVDINGLQGKSTFVTWHLNRSMPTTSVDNLKLGQLISGKITLKGIVSDGNGIENLLYSLDGGKNFEFIKIKKNKKTADVSFSLQIDSRKIPDGPAVCWFKAQDSFGTEGVYSWLFFVDNTKPEVKIVYPGSDDAVNGVFSAAGFASDVIGIEKLTWRLGSVQSGELSLIPGNPYWVADLDLRGYRGKKIDLIMQATDTAGNITTEKRSLNVNLELDKPILSIEYPKAGTLIEDSLYLRGIAQDDDGIAQVFYSFDGQPETAISTEGVFYADIPLGGSEGKPSSLAAGKHSLSVRAQDIYGVYSNPLIIPLTAAGSAPVFGAASLTAGKNETRPYVYGMEVHPEEGAVLKYNLSAGSGFSNVRWKLGNAEEVSVQTRAGQKDISLSIPFTAAPWGVVPLFISATDIAGREKTETLVFFVSDLTRSRGSNADFTAESSEKFSIASINDVPYSLGMKVVLPPQPLKDQKNILKILVQANSVSNASALLNGLAVRPLLQKTEEQGVFELQIPLEKLTAGPVSFSLSALLDKSENAAVSGGFFAVREAPLEGVDNSEKLYWLPESNIGRATDGFYTMESGSILRGYANFTEPLSVKIAGAASGSSSLSGLSVALEGKRLELSVLAEGTYKDVQITITDANGTQHKSPLVSLRVGSGLPRISITDPAPFSWVKDRVRIKGTASDSNGLSSVKWSADAGMNWQNAVLNADGSWHADIAAGGFADGLLPIDVEAASLTGGKSISRTALYKDNTPPEAEVILPRAGDVVNGETTVVFKVADKGKLSSAHALTAADGSQFIDLDLKPLVRDLTGTLARPLKGNMAYLFTDAAGNTARVNSYEFSINDVSDLPVAEIDVPASGAVVQSDFTVSGVVYDDDGVAKIWASVDGGEYFVLAESTTSFSLPFELNSLKDNDHVVKIYGEDLHGVKGEAAEVKFKVSLAEPKGFVLKPAVGDTVKGVISMKGTAEDANGIDMVQVSVDNGNTYSDAELVFPNASDHARAEWVYTFDTRIMQGGHHVVILRIVDKYGIQGLFSSLLNIDNTAPEIQLELPLDGSKTAGDLFFSGQMIDNVGVEKLWVNITALSRDIPPVPAKLARVDFKPREIIAEVVDISSLPNGIYNIELIGEDAGGNARRVSRNVELDSSWQAASVDIMYPLNGKHVQGVFNLYGQAVSGEPIVKIALYVDSLYVSETSLSETGYFKFTLGPDLIKEGTHKIQVQAQTESGKYVSSVNHKLVYAPFGPWISIDNFTMGDFAIERPWLRGSAGYIMTDADTEALKSKTITKAEKERIRAMKIKKVEISFDNGQTFKTVGKSEKWRYRIENEDMKQGYHFLIARAQMENGEIAITRSIIRVDNTAPTVKLIAPEKAGRYNEELRFAGLSSDDVKLQEVKLSLRKGDKSAYEVPGFIRGLYFDFHFLGATLYDIGVGLSFFDDNVKLQFQIGQLSSAQFLTLNRTDRPFRYGGLVMGGKILANIGTVQFRRFFGPDWAWLSASFALGANFSWFGESQSGKGQMLSALLGQIEFPRIRFPKAKIFSTLSFYTEGQLWFIPTDVQGTEAGGKIASVIPQIGIGIRLNVF